MGVYVIVALPLADAIDAVANFVNVFISVYILLIFAYILTSWIRLPYSVWMSRIQRFLYDVCEPYLRIFRRILPPLGPLDLSPKVVRLSAKPSRQAWLKKPPPSSMRARSSAETSTLRGVSRKTLSATRCMFPSSA